MANKDSLLYAKLHTNKQVSLPTDRGGFMYAIPIEHTVAADANGDTVNLAVLPLGAKILDIDLAYDALGASTTLSIGDAGSATRYIPSTGVTAAGRVQGPSTTAGQNFIQTADTILLLTWGGATPTNAATLKGVVKIIPAL